MKLGIGVACLVGLQTKVVGFGRWGLCEVVHTAKEQKGTSEGEGGVTSDIFGFHFSGLDVTLRPSLYLNRISNK